MRRRLNSRRQKKRESDASAELSASLGFNTRFIAEKIPGAQPEPLPVDAADAGSGDERTVAAQLDQQARTPTAFHVQDSQVPHSAAADLGAGGTISYRLEGAPEQGEQGTALATSHVISKLNEAGGKWFGAELMPRNAKLERGVDAVATSADGSRLEVQVVRAERGLWQALEKQGAVQGELTIDEAADALWLSIEMKRSRADPKVILILDAANVGQFAFQPVIDRFRERRGIDATKVGFKEIWLAAPTAERTVRLDTPM